MLIILTEFTLVFYPVVLQKVPIVVRELFMQLFWILIVKFTVSVELLIEPFSVIGWMVLWVEKNTLSVDFIVMEIALIVSSVAVDQLSVTFLQTIFAHTFIFDTIFILFLQINQVGFFFLHHFLFYLIFDFRKTRGWV